MIKAPNGPTMAADLGLFHCVTYFTCMGAVIWFAGGVVRPLLDVAPGAARRHSLDRHLVQGALYVERRGEGGVHAQHGGFEVLPAPVRLRGMPSARTRAADKEAGRHRPTCRQANKLTSCCQEPAGAFGLGSSPAAKAKPKRTLRTFCTGAHL